MEERRSYSNFAASAALHGAVLAMILAGSLIYGVILTEDKPAFAYFDTFARAWELGIGAALALAGAGARSVPSSGSPWRRSSPARSSTA